MRFLNLYYLLVETIEPTKEEKEMKDMNMTDERLATLLRRARRTFTEAVPYDPATLGNTYDVLERAADRDDLVVIARMEMIVKLQEITNSARMGEPVGMNRFNAHLALVKVVPMLVETNPTRLCFRAFPGIMLPATGGLLRCLRLLADECGGLDLARPYLIDVKDADAIDVLMTINRINCTINSFFACNGPWGQGM